MIIPVYFNETVLNGLILVNCNNAGALEHIKNKLCTLSTAKFTKHSSCPGMICGTYIAFSCKCACVYCVGWILKLFCNISPSVI